jgi:tetratricopeptide (TPR) repeat protein
MGNVQEAIVQLVELLDTSPTDAEAWAKLADMYLSQGITEQAIYCLEEVLLIQPNAWNVSACKI